MTTTPTSLDMAPAAERLDAIAAGYFDSLSAFKAYGALSPDEQRGVLEYTLELCDETGVEGVGVLSRESIVEKLRQGDADRLNEQPS